LEIGTFDKLCIFSIPSSALWLLDTCLLITLWISWGSSNEI